MQIGIILAPYGEKRPSGLSAYILNLTLALVRQNLQDNFHVFIKGEHTVTAFESFNNVTVTHMPANALWKDIAVLQNKNVDVWLYNNPSMPFFIKPKKSVVTALDFGAFYPADDRTYLDRVKLFFLKLLQNNALHNASHILCTSFATQADLHQFFNGIEKEKVSVAMCGFTRVCEVYEPAVVENLPDDYFLLVGVIKPRKNQLTAVKAFILAKDKGLKSKLVITGKGGGEYFDLVMDEINRSSYKGEIHYVGYSSNEQMSTLYKKARALIFPSHVEGFGMPIAEAMSCSVPVITSSNGALGEVAEGYAVTVDSTDVLGFADAMLLFQDDVVRQEYIKKGHERVKDFSWEKSAQEYIKVIKNVLTLNM